MKKSLFLYLFILSVLVNIFTYAYFSKQVTFSEKRLESSTKRYKDSLTSVSGKLDDANYFALENNQNAQDYFATTSPIDISYEELIPIVQESLLSHNDNVAGNPYTGQDRIGSQKFIINKAKVLNHRWIIADFSDGEYWGEVLLKYFVNGDNTISFEVIQSFIYSK